MWRGQRELWSACARTANTDIALLLLSLSPSVCPGFGFVRSLSSWPNTMRSCSLGTRTRWHPTGPAPQTISHCPKINLNRAECVSQLHFNKKMQNERRLETSGHKAWATCAWAAPNWITRICTQTYQFGNWPSAILLCKGHSSTTPHLLSLLCPSFGLDQGTSKIQCWKRIPQPTSCPHGSNACEAWNYEIEAKNP